MKKPFSSIPVLKSIMPLYLILLLIPVKQLYAKGTSSDSDSKKKLTLISREVSSDTSKFYNTIYLKKGDLNLRTNDYISSDNGKSWVFSPLKPDFSEGLPYGYRREYVISVFDDNTKRYVSFYNSLDVPELDPDIIEPPIAQETYYLRYRVSEGETGDWLFDEPVVQSGNYTKENPFPGVYIGSNSIYIGDLGSRPVISQNGKILLPAQTTPLGPDGKLWNPGGGFTYTDAVVLIGTWEKDGKISWIMSERIEANPEKSTRGMIEPTLAEMENGKLLMVMRGSNDKNPELPSYKWSSVSDDGGISWSEPEPFTFEDGTPFYSPSAMSTLFRHSTGRCFWIGNMSDKNCQGNLPRWPLIIAEVNTKTLKLIKQNLLIVDTYQEEDSTRGRLDLSHFTLTEDSLTNEIILAYPRSYNSYQEREWITVIIKI